MAALELEDGEIEGELQPLASTSDPCFQALKKKKKKKQKQGGLQLLLPQVAGVANGRNIYHEVYGEAARASVSLQHSHSIKLQDIQGLVLWVLADGNNPRWAFVKNKPFVQKVVLVAIPGLDSHLYEQHKALMPNMERLLGKPVTCLARSGMARPAQAVSTLFTVPMSKKRKQYLAELAGGLSSAASPTSSQPANTSSTAASPPAGRGAGEPPLAKRQRTEPPFPARHYVATSAQLRAADFPLPKPDTSGALAPPPGFITTLPSGGAGGERLVALDCEMCITEAGYELTRLSLVDDQGQVLVDQLVVPSNPITDYNTRFSGITPTMLAGVAARLTDAQAAFREHVAAETLLVGHALENDLAALRCLHGNILDTSLLFPHPRGPPFRSALRKLAEKYLKRTIQAGSHDSVDDARAAMDLVLLKIRRGPGFGVGRPFAEEGEPLLEVLRGAGVRAALVDRADVLQHHTCGSASAVVVQSDADAAVKAAAQSNQTPLGFVWAQLRDLTRFQEQRSAARRAAARAEPAEAAATADAGKEEPDAAEEDAEVAGVIDEPHLECRESTPARAASAEEQLPLLPAGPGPAAPIAASPANGLASGFTRKPPALADEISPAAGPAATEPPPPSQANGNARAEGQVREGAACGRALVPEPEAFHDERLAGVLREVDAHMATLLAGLPPNALLLVATCHGDTADVRRLQEQKYRRAADLEGGVRWTVEDEAALCRALTRAKQALAFAVVKC